MSQLEKAKLQEVRADRNETTEGEPVEVQFNPTSLKLKITNSVEGGQSRGRQRRQQNAKSSTVLTLELIFDSADEDENGAPVSVRKKTAIIEKYVFAKKDGTETPPKLRFEWKEFIVTGIVESVDMDFDLFAPDGTALRAKASLSLKEQDSKYMLLREGAGARNSDNGRGQGGGSDGRPGTEAGGGNSDRSAPALEGETAPEFAARQGLDPTAWRGLNADLSAGLSLDAGVEIGFNAGLSAGAGIGLSAGIQAGIDVSLEASVGLEASLNASVGGGSISAGLNADAAAGFALSAAGGLDAAIETVKINKSQVAEETAVRAFSAPSISASNNFALRSPQVRRDATESAARAIIGATVDNIAGRTPSASSEQTRTPLMTTGLPSHSQQQETPTQAMPPKTDSRRVSYGSGIPLRPTFATIIENQQVGICSNIRPNVSSAGGPQVRKDPTTAPWIQLPQRDRARAKADAAQSSMRTHPCSFLYGANYFGDRS